jgi:D-glycero-D-manno-heptose 1,7-bisphosphate phosphatase
MVGDMISDLLAGINAGCRGSILVRTGKGLSEAEGVLDVAYDVADDLRAAVDLILTSARDHDASDSAGAEGKGNARMERTETLREPIP